MNRNRTPALPVAATAREPADSSLAVFPNRKPQKKRIVVTPAKKGIARIWRDQSRHSFASAAVFARARKRQRRTGMVLKVGLKPPERIIIGSCVITNTDQRARLLIDGDNIPILREKDILTPETANTPAKLIYLAVQLMYISPDPQANHGTYFNLLREVVTVMPSAWPIIEEINNHILSGDLYLALKEARKLIAYEAKLLAEAEEAHPEMLRSV